MCHFFHSSHLPEPGDERHAKLVHGLCMFTIFRGPQEGINLKTCMIMTAGQLSAFGVSDLLVRVYTHVSVTL